MTFNNLIILAISLFIYFSCQTPHTADSGQYLINQLEKAENSKDVHQIKSIFNDNAILYTTDLAPIKGKTAIASIYEFIFSRNDVEEIQYKVDSVNKRQNLCFESGEVITRRTGGQKTIQGFEVVFQENEIVEITFGNKDAVRREIPQALKPSGKYSVGLSTFFYDKKQSDSGRLLSFQIWYPAELSLGNSVPFRSPGVVDAAARFLDIPIFAISYFSEIKSHSYLNAPAIEDKKFPLLIYNHGYGGFTQVYQTIFEDMASRGYIVVSIGHENESALWIKENGDVLANNPRNEFYAKRAPELNGSEIGSWQSIILNSDDLSENRKAYREMTKLTLLHNESVRLWQSDTEAAIEKLRQINKTDRILKGAFNFEAIGIFGHSLGGATAGQLGFDHSVIKAGINLDGFQFGDLINHKLEIPFMFVSSNREGNRYLRALTFLENSHADAYQVHIKGFAHDNFTDLKYLLEGEKKAMKLQRELIRSFFDKYLKNENIDLGALGNKYERLSIKRIRKPDAN